MGVSEDTAVIQIRVSQHFRTAIEHRAYEIGMPIKSAVSGIVRDSVEVWGRLPPSQWGERHRPYAATSSQRLSRTITILVGKAEHVQLQALAVKLGFVRVATMVRAMLKEELRIDERPGDPKRSTSLPKRRRTDRGIS
jgi:hypothetical protein